MVAAVNGPGPAADISEKALTALGDQMMTSRGYQIAPAASEAVNPTSGYPQKVYVKTGRMIVVEYGKTDGKLSKKQQEWAEVIKSIADESDGAVEYHYVEPADWSELRKAAS